MDPDSTASTKQILENGTDFSNDFLKDLFEPETSTMDPAQSSAEYGGIPVQYSGSHSSPNGHSFTNGHNLVNGHKSLLDGELSKKYDALKQQTKELLEKNIVLESQVAEYEVRLSQKMQDIFNERIEMDSLRESAEVNEKEMMNYKAKLEELEAQIYQLKELKINKEETDNSVAELQKDLAHKAKIQQKLRNKIENGNVLLTERNNDIKKAKQNNKKLWNLLTRFGRKLAKANLLTSKEQTCIMKEYDEEHPVSEDVESDDQNEEIDQQMEETSQSVEQLQNTTEAAPENSTPFLQPFPVVPSRNTHIEGFPFGQNSKTHQISSFNRPRSSSNYFRKTYQEVLEDPQVSDDCMDVSVTELSSMRQQLGLDKGHFTPISPIPPTPPPKANQSVSSQSKLAYTMNNPHGNKASPHPLILNNNQSQQSLVDSKPAMNLESSFNRRLAFTHQQSEGFDVAGDPPNNLDNVNNEDSQNALPKFNESKSCSQKSSCRVLAKRQNDGCLKLQFNSAKPILFEVNYDTHDVTCTFPPLSNDAPDEETTSYNVPNVSNPPRASSTPFRIHKPVLVQKSVKKEPEDTSPLVKRPRISDDREPFRLPTLNSNEAGNSGFVSYQRSGSPEARSFNTTAEGRSLDMNEPYGTGGLFHHSPPTAFVFETENSVNAVDVCRSPFTKADPDGMEKSVVNKEENKSAVSSSRRSPFQYKEQNADMLLENHNLLQLQPKQVSSKESNPAIEGSTASSPQDVINSNFEQQDVPSAVPAQGINNIGPFATPIFGTGKTSSENTGYTSSESDQCSESSFDYKPLCKRIGLPNTSNGTLRRRRKRLGNLGESSNVAPVRMKGRTLQSRTHAGKAALGKSNESDTISKEQAANGIYGELGSNKTILDSSTQGEINGLDCFSELSVFKVPKRVSRALQKKNKCSISPISEESPSESGPIEEIATTSIETHAMECSNNISSSDAETVATPCVEGTDMERNNNQNDIQNSNVNGPMEESLLKKTSTIKTYLKNSRSSALMRKSSTDEVQSDTEHKENIPKRKPRKSKSIVTGNYIAPVCPDELDGGSYGNQEFMQTANACQMQNEMEHKHQNMPKRKTRSTASKERESKAEIDAKRKIDCTLVEPEHKQTSCTDNDDIDLDQKTQRNPIRRRRKSTIDGFQNQKAVESVSSDQIYDGSNLRADVEDNLKIANSKQTVSNDKNVKDSMSSDTETFETGTSPKCKKTNVEKQSDLGDKEGALKLFNQSSWSPKKLEVEKSEANPESEKLTVSLSDAAAIEKDMLASKENSTNGFLSEEENESDNIENFTSHDTVQTSILPTDYEHKKIEIEKNYCNFKQGNVNTSSLNAKKSGKVDKSSNVKLKSATKVGKIDKSSNVAKLESISNTPTKTKFRRNAKKEVLDLHSEIQHQQTLSPGKKVIEELTANSTETCSPTMNSPLQNYKTRCTITKLPNNHNPTSLEASNINDETVSNLAQNKNLPFVLNDNCAIISITTDNNTVSPKTSNQSSTVKLTPAKTRKPCKNLPMDDKGQDFEMIDFTEMDADLLYPTFVTPLNSELNATVITPTRNIGVDDLETNNPNLEVHTSFEENRSSNKCKKELFGKSPRRVACKKTPTKAKQGTILPQSMPLSPDPVEKQEESSLSAPLASYAKEPTVTRVSISNATATSHADSPLDDPLTNLNVVEVEVETSPKVSRRTRSKSSLLECSTVMLKKPKGVATSNCCVIDDSGRISEIDSDNDSPLIIAEELLENDDPVSEDTSTISKAPTPKKTMPPKTRKRRRKAKLVTRKTRKSPSVEKEFSDFSSVEAVFQEVEKIKFTDQHFKMSVHNLVRVLIDPEHSSDVLQLIFHVVQHLHQTKRNPMMTYLFSHDISTLLPITENCVVSALFQIELKGKPQFHKLLESTTLTLYHMVLGKENEFSMFGQAALCRVLTEICKRQNNKEKPIKLCGELIKWQHQYAPYLIASMVGIWHELFQPVNNLDDEENIFFGAIARGVKDKPDKLSLPQWKQCQAIFTNLLSVKATEDKFIPRTVSLLVQRIRSKCMDNIYDKEYLLSTPLVIYSRIKGWEWARDVLMDTFIIPSIKKFSKFELNEIAFEFFLNLYAEICFDFPKEEDPYGLIKMYFFTSKENDFVHFTAAITLLKLIMWKRDYFTEDIAEWMSKWSEHERLKVIQHLFIRRAMADQDFCFADILQSL